MGFTALVLTIGYVALGLLTMLIFTDGFVSGLILWLCLPTRGTWSDIRRPYGFFDQPSRATGVLPQRSRRCQSSLCRRRTKGSAL